MGTQNRNSQGYSEGLSRCFFGLPAIQIWKVRQLLIAVQLQTLSIYHHRSCPLIWMAADSREHICHSFSHKTLKENGISCILSLLKEIWYLTTPACKEHPDEEVIKSQLPFIQNALCKKLAKHSFERSRTTKEPHSHRTYRGLQNCKHQ